LSHQGKSALFGGGDYSIDHRLAGQKQGDVSGALDLDPG